MFSYKSPKNIGGLKFWWDASDPSTVNNGWVRQFQNVYKFVDKVSGKILENFNGPLGPTYSFGAVNGKNAIHFPYHNNINGNLKALVCRSILLDDLNFNVTNKTIFFVFKPTTTQDTNATKYALSIWNDNAAGGGVIEPLISIRSGPGTNPYSEYVEPDPILEGVNDIQIKNEKSYQFGLKTSTNPDLNALQIVICKSGVKGSGKLQIKLPTKLICLQERGFDTKFDFYDTSKFGESTTLISPPFTITIGGYFYETLNKFSGVAPMEGFFCEMLYYERYLEDSEIFTIGSYLLRKWDPIRATFSNSVIPRTDPPVTIIINLPEVSTGISTNITSNSATINGNNVTNGGGGTITARGVVWATTQNPTLSNSFTSDGTGIGTFNSNITSLNPNTLYYVRAYATNQTGTSYGSQISFTTTTSITLTMDVPQDLIWDGASINILRGTIAGRVNGTTDTTTLRGFRLYDEFGNNTNSWGLGSTRTNFYSTQPFSINWRIGLGYAANYNVNPAVTLNTATNLVTHETVITNVSDNTSIYGNWIDVNFVQTGLLNYDNSGLNYNQTLARLRIPNIKVTLSGITQNGSNLTVPVRLEIALPGSLFFHKRGIFYTTTSTFTTREGRNDLIRLDDNVSGNVPNNQNVTIANITAGATYYIRGYYSILSGPNNDREVIVMSNIRQFTTTAFASITNFSRNANQPWVIVYTNNTANILYQFDVNQAQQGGIQTVGVFYSEDDFVTFNTSPAGTFNPGDTTTQTVFVTAGGSYALPATPSAAPPLRTWKYRAFISTSTTPTPQNSTLSSTTFEFVFENLSRFSPATSGALWNSDTSVAGIPNNLRCTGYWNYTNNRVLRYGFAYSRNNPATDPNRTLVFVGNSTAPGLYQQNLYIPLSQVGVGQTVQVRMFVETPNGDLIFDSTGYTSATRPAS